MIHKIIHLISPGLWPSITLQMQNPGLKHYSFHLLMPVPATHANSGARVVNGPIVSLNGYQNSKLLSKR